MIVVGIGAVEDYELIETFCPRFCCELIVNSLRQHLVFTSSHFSGLGGRGILLMIAVRQRDHDKQQKEILVHGGIMPHEVSYR